MAFPTSPLRDSFNRANEGPPATGWTTFFGSGWKVLSNVFAPSTAAATDNTALFNTSMDHDDIDVWVEMPTTSASDFVAIYIRFNSTGGPGGTGAGYLLGYSESSTTFQLERLNGTDPSTLLDNDTATNLANGDAFGARAQGSAWTGYVRQSGTWTSVLSATDNTYLGSSNRTVGIYSFCDSATVRLDNFYAGRIWEPEADSTYRQRIVTGTGRW